MFCIYRKSLLHYVVQLGFPANSCNHLKVSISLKVALLQKLDVKVNICLDLDVKRVSKHPFHSDKSMVKDKGFKEPSFSRWQRLKTMIRSQFTVLSISTSISDATPLHLVPLHYRLRSIKQGEFRLANFASHFKQKCYFHFLIHWFLLESL